MINAREFLVTLSSPNTSCESINSTNQFVEDYREELERLLSNSEQSLEYEEKCRVEQRQESLKTYLTQHLPEYTTLISQLFVEYQNTGKIYTGQLYDSFASFQSRTNLFEYPPTLEWYFGLSFGEPKQPVAYFCYTVNQNWKYSLERVSVEEPDVQMNRLCFYEHPSLDPVFVVSVGLETLNHLFGDKIPQVVEQWKLKLQPSYHDTLRACLCN